MILNNVHLAAHLLDPCKRGQYILSSQKIDAVEFIRFIAETMSLSENVMTDMADYHYHRGIYSEHFLWKNLEKIEAVETFRTMDRFVKCNCKNSINFRCN